MKKFISLVLAVVLALCSTGAFAAEVTDQAGRTVFMEETPESIVGGYYIATSALLALGKADSLVGVEAKAEKRAIYQLSAPEVMELPSVGSAKEFDLEGCAALEPDLAVLPLKLKDAAVTLEELGIHVLLVNPENQESLQEMIALLGTMTGEEERAEELLTDLSDMSAFLTETLADAERPSVVVTGNSALLSVAGGAMYQSDLVRLAGAENAAAELNDAYWQDIDYEQLLVWDPDYIVLPSDASYSVEDVLNDANLAELTAVKEGHVLQMPGDIEAWDSPVPGGVLGAVWLASNWHGDLISEDAFVDLTNGFYEKYYGFIPYGAESF